MHYNPSFFMGMLPGSTWKWALDLSDAATGTFAAVFAFRPGQPHPFGAPDYPQVD